MKAHISKGALHVIAETDAELIDLRRMAEKRFRSSYVTPAESRYVAGKGMIFFILEDPKD